METDTLTGSPDLNLVGDDEKRRYSLMSYYRLDSDDVFEKCRRFRENYDAMNEDGKLSDSLRVSLDSGLDHRSSVTDRETGRRREVVCFDSNGYLGLQHHPSVKAAVIAAVHEFGAGTPSVPLLGGTNRIVRELEKTVAAFHGREDALIFSSAYAANIGVMPALLRRGDVVLHDQCVHASILQGIRLSKNKASIEFAFNDPADLESKLQALKAEGHDGGTLVVADGVYSMHGDVLRLPEMRAVCDLYGARLIVDECHSVGVLGPRGRGVEDFYSTPGSCDLIVGCFSKALGFSGGYVTGPADVVSFLRFFGNSYVFSASLPSPLCAGILEGFRVIDREPQWLEQLRVNARYLKERVRELGVEAPAGESSIVKIPIEGNKRLFKIGAELLANGLKCGVVTFPAVRDHRGLLRLVVTARHTRRDIDEAVDILGRTLRRYGLLSR